MQKMNYVGIEKCGCIVTAISEDHPRLSHELEKWVRGGLTLQRVNNRFVKTRFGEKCEQHRGPQSPTSEQLEMGL